ncbi:MAG: hypothetical protein ABSC06_00680 [Rhodopila sp.]
MTQTEQYKRSRTGPERAAPRDAVAGTVENALFHKFSASGTFRAHCGGTARGANARADAIAPPARAPETPLGSSPGHHPTGA